MLKYLTAPASQPDSSVVKKVYCQTRQPEFSPKTHRRKETSTGHPLTYTQSHAHTTASIYPHTDTK